MGLINKTCSLLRPLSTSTIGGLISGTSFICSQIIYLLDLFYLIISQIIKINAIPFQFCSKSRQNTHLTISLTTKILYEGLVRTDLKQRRISKFYKCVLFMYFCKTNIVLRLFLFKNRKRKHCYDKDISYICHFSVYQCLYCEHEIIVNCLTFLYCIITFSFKEDIRISLNCF